MHDGTATLETTQEPSVESAPCTLSELDLMVGNDSADDSAEYVVFKKNDYTYSSWKDDTSVVE